MIPVPEWEGFMCMRTTSTVIIKSFFFALEDKREMVSPNLSRIRQTVLVPRISTYGTRGEEVQMDPNTHEEAHLSKRSEQ